MTPLTYNINRLRFQINKLQFFCRMGTYAPKSNKMCNYRKPQQTQTEAYHLQAFIQAQRIMYKEKQLSILTQIEPYTYLGIQLVPSLIWQIQIHITINKSSEQGKLLLVPRAVIRQKLLNIVIKPSIAYACYILPFSKPEIRKVDRIISKFTKKTCKIPTNVANIHTHLNIENFGINTTFILPNYLTCIGKQLLDHPNPQQPSTTRQNR